MSNLYLKLPQNLMENESYLSVPDIALNEGVISQFIPKSLRSIASTTIAPFGLIFNDLDVGATKAGVVTVNVIVGSAKFLGLNIMTCT